MTIKNVPLWCRKLIEKSSEAYMLIENDKIIFLNGKAKAAMHKHIPVFDNYVGSRVIMKDKLLKITIGKERAGKKDNFETSDLSTDKTDKTKPETITLNHDSFDLLFSDKNFRLVKLKQNIIPAECDPVVEQCYFSLFNTIKEAIFIQDRDGTILEANQGAEKMYGFPGSYFKGKATSSFSVYTQDDLELIKIGLEKVFQGENQKFEFWGKRSNGEIFPKEVFLYKGFFFGEDVVIAFTTDITERKQAEAQIEAYTLQLQELAETRDKVYSIVAHDLKSSFNSILGLSELLSEDWEILEDNRKQIFAKNIFMAADGSYKLLQNLLDWSKRQSGLLEYDPVSFEMGGVINETLSLYRLQSDRKNISVQSEITSPTFVYADVNMVQSILRNLISNAIKFTPVNGRVWVTKSEILTEDSEKNICISVYDNGVGISKKRMCELFDSKINSTTTGTANEQGTGLGILICKEMAEQNKGSLWVESEEGRGSTFSFTLPLFKQ